MKYLLAFLLATTSAFGATVTGPVGDLTGGAFNPRVEFWPLSTPLNSGNTNIVGPMKSVAVVSGNFSQVFVAGTYRVCFPPTTNCITIHVPNDTGTYSLAALSTNVSSVTGVTTTPAYRVKSTSADTNASFLSSKLVAGSNITITTNSAGQNETLTITAASGGATYTNNTGLPGVVVGSGIGTNLSTLATSASVLSADTVVSNGIITGLAAGSHPINGSLITNLQDQYTFTIPGAAFDNFSNTREILGATKTQNIDPGQWAFSEVRFPTWARLNGKLFVYFSSNDTNDFTRGGMFGFSGNDWEELGYIGQILTNSTSGWDSGHVYGGRAFTYLGTNWMTYMGGIQDNLSDPSDSVGLAYSTDGTNFTKYSGNPILSKAESYETTRIQHPTLFRANNGKFFLFYTGWRSTVTNAICFATADVITGPWTKYSGNPVVSWVTNGMTQTHAESPSILADKDGYHMWFDCFSTGTSDPRSTMETLAVAHSRDLTNWVISAERPDVFKPNGQTNNQNWIFGPQIVNDGGIRLLWEDNSSAFLSDPITKKNTLDAYIFGSRAVFISTNALSIIPEFPALAGQALIFNSNGFPYILLSTNGGGGGALTWTRTNKLGW